LGICGVTSSADSWEATEEFGKAKLQWLRWFAPFANSMPPHDCIVSLISRLSVEGFQACFANWTEAVAQTIGGETIVAALHLISARAQADGNRLALGQEVTAAKSNEITVIPKLGLLELTGCIVTIDAIGFNVKLPHWFII